MPAKRRASTSTEESAPVPKKTKKAKPVNYNQGAICQELFDTIRNHKLPDGRLLCEAFIRVPKRRTTPEYYEAIKDPIDLLKIQQKLKTEEYEEIEQLTEDLQLLVKNAKCYYHRSSQEHQDVIQVWTLYQSTKSELIAAAFGESSTPKPAVDTVIQAKCQQLLDAFKKLKNGDRLLCEVFMTLPDKKELPIYYQTISHPIDLDTISNKLQNGAYEQVDVLEQDLNLMLKNAMDFNEPGSMIYKDAETLKLMMSAVMSDIMLASPSTNISKADRRSRRSSVPAQSTDPMDEDTDTDNGGEDVDEPDEESSMLSLGDEEMATGDPYWLLFKSVATHCDEKGKSTAKPFLKLPNKRWFPDYYEDIATPISMTQVKRRIKKKKYHSLNEMAADLNLMFENAKEYNADESKIFQNAMEMQAVMWEKKKHIEAGMKIEEPVVSATKAAAIRRPAKPKTARSGKTPGSTTNEGTVVSVGSSSPSRRTSKGKARARTLISEGGERTLKQRLMSIYRAVELCEDKDGRSLIGPFIDLPSKQEYPEYYEYITEPIDMTKIEERISSDRYDSEKELIIDLKLMFNNARSFNEDGSQLYNDAGTLEKAMKRKVMALSIVDNPTEDVVKRTFATVVSPLAEKLSDLYETIKVFKDQHHRVLSTPFVRLPSKLDYAEYYEVIKKPVDLPRIQQKIQSGHYDNLENMLLDVTQMFDNAMVFNEPESILYKDAAVLLNEFLKRFDCLDDQTQYKVPDIPNQVQKMLNSLYNTAINHMDEDGRCYADSVNELDSQAVNGLTFSSISLSLKPRRYKRLDKFQEDMFAICENARRISRTDSQVYEDSTEIQKIFLIARDNMCRNGEGAGFSSPALSYTPRHLSKAIEELTAKKLADEPAGTGSDGSKRKIPDQFEGLDEMEKNGKTYHLGDFVYVNSRESAGTPHIVNVHKLWKDAKGVGWLYGGWFYRPAETSHPASRRLLSQEVFCTSVYDSIPFSAVSGRCHVMYVKDYFRNKPEEFADSDVYVCESRYCKKTKAFRKVKSLANAVTPNPDISMVSRAIPLLPTRVTSPATAVKTPEEKPVPIAISTKPIIKERKSVVLDNVADGQPGCVYYEQFVAENGMTYKLGDFVYLSPSALAHQPNVPTGGPSPIARIDKLYKDARGWYVFVGTLFLRIDSIEHTPARLFYQREVFLSVGEDQTFNLASVAGKCCVLYSKDFITYRPTEFAEEHIYVCEWKYIEGESENAMRRLTKGFKAPLITIQVCDDEIFYFPKKISIKRIASPQLFKLCAESYIQDQDDEDSREQSMTPQAHSDPFDLSRSATSPGPGKSVKKRKKHHITSFQIFANVVRRSIQDDNPGATFGVVSQLIAAKWRGLTDEEVQNYKDKALKLQAETKAREAAADRAAALEAARNPPPPTQFNKDMFPQGQQPFPPGQPGMLPQAQQFTPHQPQYQQQGAPPHMQPIIPGMVPGTPMHIQPGFSPQRPMMMPDGQQWHGVLPGMPLGQPQPMFSGQSPMPPHSSMQQFQGQHNMTGSPMHRPSPAQTPDQNHPHMMQQQQPMHIFQVMPASQAAAVTSQQNAVAAPPKPPQPPSPNFVSVDLPPQKLSHSEVYLRYIGGLRGDNPVKISNWERELNPEHVPPPNPARLPAHWLGNGAGAHESILSALHSLRDVMLRDSLKLQRVHQL